MKPDELNIPKCDKCDEPNDRASFANYCSKCAREFKARLAADPETAPVGSEARANMYRGTR